MSSGKVQHRFGPLVILEFLLIIGCYVLTTYLWLGASAVTYLLYESGLNADVFTAGGLIVLMYFQGLYGPHRRGGVDLALRLISALGVGFLLEASVFYIQKNLALPLSVMVAGSGMAFLALFVCRLIYYSLLSGGFGPERILMIGATPVNRKIAARIQSSPDYGMAIVGFLDDVLAPGTELEGGTVLGPLASLPKIRRNLTCHRIVTDFSQEEIPLRLMAGSGVSGGMEKPDALYEMLFSQVCSLHPADLLFENEFAPPRFRIVLQSIYTNLLALGALIVTLPAIVAIAILIRVRCGGPVFETQPTIGWNLTPFTRLRFCCHRVVKTEAGERIELTETGEWLQRLRLQCLPQLVNVLRGEMALVGPPALRAEVAAALIEAFPYYRLAYLVKPGLVSWSRLNGAEEDVASALRYDLHYIKSVSPSLDFSIFSQGFSASRRRG